MTSFKTRNGREVKDGGGVLPDIVIDPGKYGMIIRSLLKERLFFNYATVYRFLNDSIADNFIFSDIEFSNFKTFFIIKIKFIF